MATAPPSSPRSFNPYDCIDVGCFGVIRAAGTAYAVNRDPGSGRSNIFKIGPGHIQGNPRAGQNCEFILKGTFFMVPGFPFAIPGVSPGPLSRRSGVYITLNDGIKTIGLPDELFVSSSPYLKICIRTGQINYIVNMGGHGIVPGFSDFEVRRVIGSSQQMSLASL